MFSSEGGVKTPGKEEMKRMKENEVMSYQIDPRTQQQKTTEYNLISLTRKICMEEDIQEESLAEFKERRLGGWGLLQLTAGTGLAVYAMWAGILMPGFRRVPLKLQVPYIPASKRQVQNVMTLLKSRSGGLADLGSGDGRIVLEASQLGFSPAVGYELNPWLLWLARFHAWKTRNYGRVSYRREDLWKVDLSGYKNITVFLAPSVLPLLQEKLLVELPEDALIVAGRFPFPDWTPCSIVGEGVERAWAYQIQALRGHNQSKGIKMTVESS